MWRCDWMIIKKTTALDEKLWLGVVLVRLFSPLLFLVWGLHTVAGRRRDRWKTCLNCTQSNVNMHTASKHIPSLSVVIAFVIATNYILFFIKMPKVSSYWRVIGALTSICGLFKQTLPKKLINFWSVSLSMLYRWLWIINFWIITNINFWDLAK